MMFNRRKTFKLSGGFISSMLLLLIGCTVGPKYSPPDMQIPCQWHNDTADLNEVPDVASESKSCCWWESFNDPELNALIERASEQNLDLHIAASRILESRLMNKGGSASLYPRLDASATYGHAQFNQKTLNNILGKASCQKDSKSGTRNVDVYEIGFDAEWEIDLFGAARHEGNALKADLEASKESFYSIWVSLSAEVAKNYIELRGYQKRLDLLNQHINAQNDTLNLIDGLQQTGFVSTIDKMQAQQQLSELSSQKPLLELQVDSTIYRLSVLLGYAPGDLYCELFTPEELPCVPSPQPLCLPSELLRRRPDVRKAERELAAATERVGAAIAAMFPRLSLRGFIGDLTTNINSPGYASFVGPQLLLPIFNSRLLLQDVDYSKIKVKQALYEYQKTVLAALEETENAIAAYHYELERNGHLKEAERLNTDVYTNTIQLYQHGFKDYLEVLVTNRLLLNAQDASIQSQVGLLMDYIALYKAMGGDWLNSTCNDEISLNN